MPRHPNDPRMIVVDGVSSSGKSSLIRAFSRIAKYPHCSYSVDGFLPSLAPGVFEARAGDDEGWIAICADFHRHLVNARTSARRMIVEVVLAWPEAREDLFAQLRRGDIYYVQLWCSLDELERREEQRGDRRCGLARSQFERVYGFDGYDLRIDSTRLAPLECARLLRRHAWS